MTAQNIQTDSHQTKQHFTVSDGPMERASLQETTSSHNGLRLQHSIDQWRSMIKHIPAVFKSH